MVNIIPFRGYRFNSEKIADFGKVMAPPYDTISQAEQDALYSCDPYNIVRLNKGVHFQDDNDMENVFTRASDLLKEWIESRVLIAEDKPSLYLYEQEVIYKNTKYANLGLVGLLALEDLNSTDIIQCERPNQSSKPARATLLENTQANISMINCIYMEYEKTLMNFLNAITEKCEPDMKFHTHETIIGEDVNQRVWVISHSEQIHFILEILKKQTLYIADGQTRYEVSLDYKRKCQAANPNHNGKEPYNYIMALFTNAFDDGLIQLPVHRLIKLNKHFAEGYFIAAAQDYFKVEKIIVDTIGEDFVDTMKKQTAAKKDENRFSLYCGGNYFYRLTLKDTEQLKMLLPDTADALLHLDAIVLNHLILRDLLNITEDKMNDSVFYTTRSSYGVQAVKDQEYACMFVLNPVQADQICGVALEHERMPERSMFIFPKAATGVVLYKMEGDVL